MYTRNAQRALSLQYRKSPKIGTIKPNKVNRTDFIATLSQPCKNVKQYINNYSRNYRSNYYLKIESSCILSPRWNSSYAYDNSEGKAINRKSYYNPRKRQPVLGDRYQKVAQELNNEIIRLEKEVENFMALYDKNHGDIEGSYVEKGLHKLLKEYTDIFRKKKMQVKESTFDIVESDYVMGEFDASTQLLEKASVSIDKLAHLLLDREEKLYMMKKIEGRLTNTKVNLNKIQHLHTALFVWSQIKSDLAVEKILLLLQRMEYIENLSRGQSQVCPNTFTCNTTMTAIIKCYMNTPMAHRDRDKTWNFINGLFLKMKESSASRKRPDKFTYHNIMNFCVNSKPWKDATVGIQVEDYLKELQALYQKTKNKSLHAPDKHTYGIAMYAHVRSGRVDRAETLLRKLDRLYRSTKDVQLYRPNMVVFGTVVSGWARNHGDVNSANHANRTLHWMIQSYHEGNPDTKPTWIIFNHVIDAYCKTKRPKSAESIFQLMEQEYFAGNTNVKPNVRTFGILTNGWAKQKSSFGAQKALQTLEKMQHMGVEPNEVIYNSILNAISNSGDPNAGPKAEKLLQDMHHLYNTNQNKYVKPDAKSYTCVMTAWQRTKPQNSEQKNHIIQKIENILKQMEFLSNKNKEDADIAPDLYNYNVLLQALSQHGEDGDYMCQRALDIIQHVEDQYYNHNSKKLVPTDYLYNSALNVIAKSKKPGSSKQLFSVLQKFEELATKVNPSFIPCAITHSIILEGLRKDPSMSCKHETVDAAEGILNETMQRYRNGENRFRPKLVMFDQVIMLIANSHIQNKTERAWKIFLLLKQAQEELSIKELHPKVHTYNWLLTCATFEIGDNMSKNPISILELATKIYTEMKESEDPSLQVDSLTYHNLLNIARKFIPNEVHKRNVIEDIFVRCCLDGLVDRGILKTLHNCSPGIFYERVIGEDGKGYRPFVDANNYPEVWMRNVASEYRPQHPVPENDSAEFSI